MLDRKPRHAVASKARSRSLFGCAALVLSAATLGVLPSISSADSSNIGEQMTSAALSQLDAGYGPSQGPVQYLPAPAGAVPTTLSDGTVIYVLPPGDTGLSFPIGDSSATPTWITSPLNYTSVFPAIRRAHARHRKLALEHAADADGGFDGSNCDLHVGSPETGFVSGTMVGVSLTECQDRSSHLQSVSETGTLFTHGTNFYDSRRVSGYYTGYAYSYPWFSDILEQVTCKGDLSKSSWWGNLTIGAYRYDGTDEVGPLVGAPNTLPCDG